LKKQKKKKKKKKKGKIDILLNELKEKLHVAALLNEPFHFFLLFLSPVYLFPKFSSAISLLHLSFFFKFSPTISLSTSLFF
jgi:pilus assembly protein TadC